MLQQIHFTYLDLFQKPYDDPCMVSGDKWRHILILKYTVSPSLTDQYHTLIQ